MNQRNDQIVEYYDSCEKDYRRVWHLDESLALHAGFWDETVKTLPQALMRENELLAQMANIKKEDRVLDAGCGIGGSSLYLAKNIGCRVTGITISSKQVQTATKLSQERKLDHLADFKLMDFCQTSFPEGTFDVVWAVESVCHAKEKRSFIKEAYRILRPGGRLIIADGFSKNMKTSSAMNKWLNGWAVESLENGDNFKKLLYNSDFTRVEIKDMTSYVTPSSKRLFYLSFPAYILSKWGELIKRRTSIQTNNIKAAFYQYITLKKGLWNYLVFTSIKN